MKSIFKFSILIILAMAIYFIFKGKINSVLTEVYNFLSQYKLRGKDATGNGAFGSRRVKNGKVHSHQGTDLKFNEGDPVQAPFDCKVIRIGYPYTDTKEYKLLEVEGTNQFKGFKAKLMYVNPLPNVVGKEFKQGQKIATAQNISKKYSGNMINHVHFELRQGETLLNPESYL